MTKNNNYYRAAGYYRRHSNADTIRKIQNFLSARGYDVGDLDGLFGQKTYNAIRKYQQDNNVDVDGMWGESTNSVHRVLNATDAPYRTDNSGSSGAHKSYMKGVNTGKDSTPLFKDQNELYKWIDQLKNKYYSKGGDEWFWGDSEDAQQHRNFLHKTKQGREILNEFFDDYDSKHHQPGSSKPPIAYRKMTNDQGAAVMKRSVAEGIDSTVPYIATLLTLPTALANPLATGGALAGGYFGGKAGKQVGSDLGHGKPHTETQTGLMGTAASSAMPGETYGGQQGELYGTILGSILGGLAGDYMGKNFNYSDWKRGIVNSNYRRPVTVQRPRVTTGSNAQMRGTNGRYGSNISVQPGSFISGAGDGWGNFYKNLSEAMRANPGADVDLTFIRP